MISQRRRPPASKTQLSRVLKVEALALDHHPWSSCWSPEQSPKKTPPAASRHHRLLLTKGTMENFTLPQPVFSGRKFAQVKGNF
jgi:hypothetical protein